MPTLADVAARAPLRRGDANAAVRPLQAALNAKAGTALTEDGVFGRLTEAAVKHFQALRQIPVTGVVDVATARAIDALPLPAVFATRVTSALTVAPWLSQMRSITGIKEVPGPKDNPVILGWRDKIIAAFPELKPGVQAYVHDEIPWCGLTTAYCMALAGQRPPLLPLYATNWFYAWKDGIKLHEPALGAVLVKTRNGGGHVTFYEGEDASFYYGRGGNQSDMVNVMRIPKVGAGVLGFMWPKSYPMPTGGRVHRSFAEAVAGSEA